MKKVLWIACLLLVIPFFGYSQKHAGLATQDVEALFGPAPVSTELPSSIQMNNIELPSNTRSGGGVWGHAMFIPVGEHHYGYYYEIALPEAEGGDAVITPRALYHNYYFTSAEYYKPWPVSPGSTDDQFPVWAYASDLKYGFHRLEYETGADASTSTGEGSAIPGTSVEENMYELTFDYFHDAPGRDGRMLGLKYGIIYLVEMGNPGIGTVTPIYTPTGNQPIPIAMACDLTGDLYFVSLSLNGQNSALYKFAATDGNLTTPIKIGTDLGWKAQHLQTMAFDHKTRNRDLFWWQCDENGNTNLVKIDKVNGTTTLVATTGTTEMGGLIFEFEYRPYNVEGQSTAQGTIKLGTGFDLLTTTAKPAEVVQFKVVNLGCNEIDQVEVIDAQDNTVYYTIPATDLVDGVGSFTMLARDVKLRGTWHGVEHEVSLDWRHSDELTDALTTSATMYQAGTTVTVNYLPFPYYYVSAITASYIDEEGNTQYLETDVDKVNRKVTFEMPCYDVRVYGDYKATVLGNIDPICQFGHIQRAPNAGHSLDGTHRHIFTFYSPDADGDGQPDIVEEVGGATVTNEEINDIIENLDIFTIPGTWRYTTTFIHPVYGDFETGYKTFKVYPSPKSIAIQEEFELENGLIYNPHYNCDGDSIMLKVVFDPADFAYDGTFTWTKGGVEIATTTEPVYLKKPADRLTDGGYYNVTYHPNIAKPDGTPITLCDKTLDNDFDVNVASLPNNPVITTKDGRNPICFGQSTTLVWQYGVLNPFEYDVKWFAVDGAGEWTLIPDETSIEYTTPVLEGPASYAVQINYALEGGDYYLCHSESAVFTVEVSDQFEPQIAGDTVTCQGIVPDGDDAIRVLGEFDSIAWHFDGQYVANSNVNALPFDEEPAATYLRTGEGGYKVYVETFANGTTGCPGYAEFWVRINQLPEITITNNLYPEIVASSNDDPLNPKEIHVCEGDRVMLTGNGGNSYIWGENAGSYVGETYSFLASTTQIYQVQGTVDETGCENHASLKVIVHERPTITWIVPSEATPEHPEPYVFNMYDGEVQLEATPVGGTFTYIIKGEPLSAAKPIPNGILKPSVLGIGDYQLIYQYTDENGCTNEIRVRDITIRKRYWTDPDIWDPEWYAHCTSQGGYGRFEIHTPNEMGSFMAYIYGLNGVTKTDWANDTIWIMKDIDLEGYFYRPTCDGYTFNGVIDGTAHVVSNMTILEPNLKFYLDGFIRNVGVKDAKITSEGARCVIDVAADARFHNSYVTNPDLTNVLPKLNPATHTTPAGSVRNVYYYGKVTDNLPMLAVYMESNDHIVLPEINPMNPTSFTPLMPTTLLHVNDGEVEIPAAAQGQLDYTGILERWVWMQNDFYYKTWRTDAAQPMNYENYGYPLLEASFIHHHLVEYGACEDPLLFNADGDPLFTVTGTHKRTIDGNEYEYAFNGETITITVPVNEDYPYTVVDKLVCTVEGYSTSTHTTEDRTFEVTGTNGVFTFDMPLDTLYWPAYNIQIDPVCSRRYWHLDNWDETWYNKNLTSGAIDEFVITNNRELAAFGHAVLVDGITFEGKTVRIWGGDGLGSDLIDMTGYYWMPVEGFLGDFDGTHYIVDNLFIREGVNAMFVNCNGSVRNLGIQDANLPMGEGAASATFMYNDANYSGTVINAFATHDPATPYYMPLANQYVTVTNCYTLNAGNNMIDENLVGTDLNKLSNWVHTMNDSHYWDWTTDDDHINYNYPIHDGQWVPGHSITYDPSFDDHENGTTTGGTENPGYVDGPGSAIPGESVTVYPHPDPCANCTALWYVDLDGNNVDILETIPFVMPDYPITIHGTFVKWDWKLTVKYIVDANQLLNPTQVVIPNMHYGDAIVIPSAQIPLPNVPGFEPEDELVGGVLVDGTMPCNDTTIYIHYVGKEHTISFCQTFNNNPISDYVESMTTNPAGKARYYDVVTVTIVPKGGLSVTGINVTPAPMGGVQSTGNPGQYTFVMPSGNVTICPEFTEEFWDDYLIADIESWFVGHEDDAVYTLTTDSMLGGLAALVSSRPWLVNEGYYTAAEVATFDFANKTIIVEARPQDNGVIDLIEHKWRPIGAQIDYLKLFQGYFDGNNVEIINMTTSDFTKFNDEGNGSCQAFFGNVGANAVITNLNISGDATGRYFTAGIAGVNYGTIVNSVANVTLKTEFSAGGLVGNNLGSIYNSYCIADTIDCMAAMPVKSTNNYFVGGVAGNNEGEIINCHSFATLWRGGTLGNNPTNLFGGVVGRNLGLVDYCYWKESATDGGQGDNEGVGVFTHCDVITAGTATLMNNKAAANDFAAGFELNGWKQGAGYPVFDLERIIMNSSENELNVDLYPNPTKGMVNIFGENLQRVSVFNMFGQMVLDVTVNANQTTVDMSTFSAGVYMVRIATAQGVTSKNVIVE